jgi:NADH:ubiquinone oxidoreductase subunit H
LFSVILLIGLSALGTAVAMRVEIVSKELDLLLWSLTQTLSIVWAALLASTAEHTRRVRTGLRAGASAFLHQLPILALLLVCIFEVRSFRLVDLVDSQETFLVGWNVFRSPAHLLLTVLALLALVPRVSAGVDFDVHREESSARAPSRMVTLSAGLGNVLGGTVHLWASALLIALLGFGGYRVPLASITQQSSTVALQLLGVVVLFAKATLLVLAVTFLRYVAGDVRLKDSFEPWIRYVLALVAIALGFSALWSFVERRYSLVFLEEATAWLLLLSTLASLGLVVHRAFVQARLTRNEAMPNPWI